MAYPASLDNLPVNKGNSTDAITGTPTGGAAGDHAQNHNNANAAINNIEAELGLDPSGAFATVAARLASFAFGAFAGGDAGKAAVWDGSQFVPDVARELAYVESTSGFTVTSTSLTDSPLGTISVPPTTGPIEVEFYAPVVGHSVTGGVITAALIETTSGSVQRQMTYKHAPSANYYLGDMKLYKRFAASASTRTFKVQTSQFTGGTGFFVVDAGGGAVHFTARRL